jgi:hypothetical protein
MTIVPSLWDHEVDVEVLEALPTIYQSLTPTERFALIEAILAGPAYDDEERAALGEDSIEHQVFLRLEAIGAQARADSATAGERHSEILGSHPSWAGALETHVLRREPQVYSKSLVRTVEPEVDPEIVVASILSPRAHGSDEFYAISGLSMGSRGDAIRHACTLDDGDKAVRVLLSIGRDDLADGKSCRELLHMLCGLTAEASRRAHREIAALLDIVSEQVDPSAADVFLRVWDVILPSCLSVRDDVFVNGPPDYLSGAISSSSGRATHALLKLLGKTDLQRDGGIAAPFQGRLESVVRSREPGSFYGRILVASRLYLLSWLDIAWTKTELAPFLSWENTEEAAGAWQGYLWSPRMDGRLFEVIRADFVETFAHVDELRGMGESLSGLLVSLAIDAPERMTAEETRRCLRTMDSSSRQRVAWLLAKRLEATEVEKRADLWRDRIDPWLSQHWPVEEEFANGDVGDRLGWAATFAGDAFPGAVHTILPIVTATEDPLMTLSALGETDLTGRFPQECLQLVDRLLGPAEERRYLYGLGSVLTAIRAARPSLADTPPFLRLKELVQALGDST